MKIEKLTENKIRIVVKSEELSNNNINIKDFVINNVNSKKFLLNILNKAEKEVGFIVQNCKLLIEVFSSLDNFFVFTITKLVINKKKNFTLKKNKNYKILKPPIYEFSSFEEFCCLCKALKKSNIPINSIARKISLYFFNNTYYLIFSNLNLSYKNFKKLFLILSEFASITKNLNNFDAKIFEYGKPVIKQNAFKIGFKYFV